MLLEIQKGVLRDVVLSSSAFDIQVEQVLLNLHDSLLVLEREGIRPVCLFEIDVCSSDHQNYI